MGGCSCISGLVAGAAGGTAVALLVFAVLTPYWYNLDGVNVSIRKGFVCLEEDDRLCKRTQKSLAIKNENVDQAADGSFTTTDIQISFYIFCGGGGMAVLSVVMAAFGLCTAGGFLFMFGGIFNLISAAAVGTAFGWFLKTFMDPEQFKEQLTYSKGYFYFKASGVKDQVGTENYFGTSFFATAAAAGLLIMAALFNFVAPCLKPKHERHHQ
ncbi:unnamed protein product [Bursaphelenchus okinawaensis]|uniref:Uncharacterized protein n=1 Tax=Bursaphelenchus okinawaensis TaxID=465554 RepID=A0A811KBY5_9BILA|nr:unnamed protein product [Bursaphelenchus okinawaensis]CAG9098623.1 unnamed protein product [Bursaphelenchus okinawaensis]